MVTSEPAERLDALIVSWCRRPLSEVVCVVGGVSYRLLWLPAVLHRQDQLRLHPVLQHAALQRAQEAASPSLRSEDVQAADVHRRAPPPGRVRDAAPADVGGGA